MPRRSINFVFDLNLAAVSQLNLGELQFEVRNARYAASLLRFGNNASHGLAPACDEHSIRNDRFQQRCSKRIAGLVAIARERLNQASRHPGARRQRDRGWGITGRGRSLRPRRRLILRVARRRSCVAGRIATGIWSTHGSTQLLIRLLILWLELAPSAGRSEAARIGSRPALYLADCLTKDKTKIEETVQRSDLVFIVTVPLKSIVVASQLPDVNYCKQRSLPLDGLAEENQAGGFRPPLLPVSVIAIAGLHK